MRSDAKAKEAEALATITRLRPRLEAALAPPGAAGSQGAAGLSQLGGLSQAGSAVFSQSGTGTLDVPAPEKMREVLAPKAAEAAEQAAAARAALHEKRNRAAGRAALINSNEMVRAPACPSGNPLDECLRAC